MHPSERLRGTTSRLLEGKTIVLGVTGSIAAVRSVELARELLRHGARVIPVMTREAARIIHPNALEFATGMKPITEITGQVEHVAWLGLGGAKADLFLIAPATGNTISKIALGIDDSPVTTFAATGIATTPLLIAPAMHETMHDNPFLTANIDKLRASGVLFVEATMEEGKAKLAEPETIVEHVLRALGPKTLASKRVLVINGATQEPIDDMRVISNKSSGAMGAALAQEAWRLGAEVEVWFAHGEATMPAQATITRFSTVHDLLALAQRAREFDIVLVPAALSDYAPDKAAGKIPSSAGHLKLDLAPLPKAIDELSKHVKGKLVPFKAESGISDEELVERARKSLRRVNAALVVANNLQHVTPDSTRVFLVDEKHATLVEGAKSVVARAILEKLG